MCDKSNGHDLAFIHWAYVSNKKVNMSVWSMFFLYWKFSMGSDLTLPGGINELDRASYL